jgi:hypothetical protein
VRGDHRRTVAHDGIGTLTIHAGEWAYCHAEATTTPHAWLWIGAVELATLKNSDHNDERLADEAPPLDSGSIRS